MLLLGHIHCGADETLEHARIETRRANPSQMSKLAVWSQDAVLDIATWTSEQHRVYRVCHARAVLRVDARKIFVDCRGSLGRIETMNPEQLRRPIVEETGRVE